MVKIYRAWQIALSRHGKILYCGPSWQRGDQPRWISIRANRRTIVEQLIAQINQEATNNVFSTMVPRMLLRVGLRSRSLVSCTYTDYSSSVTKTWICTLVPPLNVYCVTTDFFLWITFYAPSDRWTWAYRARNVWKKQASYNNSQIYSSWWKEDYWSGKCSTGILWAQSL